MRSKRVSGVRLDDLADHARHGGERRHRRLVVHVQHEQRAPLAQPPEVAHPRLQDVAVGR